MVLSGVFKSSAFLCWYFWQDFYGFAAGFALWGFGSSLRSGAWEALLFDQLQAFGAEEKFTFHYGKITAVGTFSVVLGEVSGGLLISNGYDFVLLVSAAIPILASLPFAIIVKEPTKHVSQQTIRYMTHLVEGVSEVLSKRGLRYLFLSAAFLLTIPWVLDEYIAPILWEQSFSLSMIAFLTAPIILAQATGEFLAGKFTHFSISQLLSCMAISSVLVISVAWFQNYWIALMLGLFFFTFGLSSTVFAGRLQKMIEGASRATVTSSISLGEGLGSIIWFIVFGSLSKDVGMVVTASTFGLITLLACLLFYVLARQWNLNHEHHSA